MIRILCFGVFLASAYGDLRAPLVKSQYDVNTTNVIHAFRYTLGHLFCVQVISDGSDFGDFMMRGVHRSSRSLVNSFQEVSSGFYLVAEDLIGLEFLLIKLRRWAKHRILCLLHLLPEQDLQSFLETRLSLFRDAEIFIAKAGSPIGYQLTLTYRRFTPIIFEGKQWLPEKEGGIVNFNRRRINVTTFNCSSFSEINYPYTAGSDMEIFLEIASRLNLSYDFIVPNDTKYPLGTLKNGTWVGGLLGLLASDQADVGFCGLWIANNKVNTGIEMSVPFRRICLKYLVPRPTPLDNEWYGIFSPYSVNVWISILLVFLLMSLLLPMIAYLDSLITSCEGHHYLTFKNGWILVAGILMSGSWMRSTRSQGPCRHLITWWTLFSLLVGSVFSSSLASYLTRPAFTAKPETIEDLVKGGYHWTATRQPFVDTLFNLNDPIHVEWTKRVRVVKTKEELQEALHGRDQVIWGFEMYGVFSLLDEDIPEHILDAYELSSECFSEFYIGFGFRQGSPYTQFFNEQLDSMREAGLVNRAMRVTLERWMKTRKYMYKVTHLSKNIYRRSVLTLVSLKGIFEFWAIGLFIAFHVFVVEVTYDRISRCLSASFNYFRDSRKFYYLKNSMGLYKKQESVK